jgi:hypothetical protein
VWTAKLSGIEIFRNIYLDQPFSAYSPIVKLLSMPHLKYRKDTPTTGVLMGNTQVQWAIYDKAAEMRKRGVRSAATEANILRCELRLRKGSSVRRHLKLATVRDLLDHHDQVEPFYIEMVKKHLMKLPNKSTPRDLEEHFELDGFGAFCKRSLIMGIQAQLKNVGEQEILAIMVRGLKKRAGTLQDTKGEQANLSVYKNRMKRLLLEAKLDLAMQEQPSSTRSMMNCAKNSYRPRRSRSAGRSEETALYPGTDVLPSEEKKEELL